MNKSARPRLLLIAMMLLQLLLLAGTGLAGAAANNAKLIPLAVYTFISGVAVIFLPNPPGLKLKLLTGSRLTHGNRPLIALLLVTAVVGVYYASVQRIWTWDEENSFQAAMIVAEGGIPSLIRAYGENPWLSNQHPPLMMVIYGYALVLFGEQLIVMRMVALVIGLATVAVTYLLGRELYDQETGFLASVFLLSFPLLLRQATAALTDIPVTFLFALALLLVARMTRRPTTKLYIGSAFLVGAGVVTKYTMIFIYPVLLGYYVVLKPFRKVKRFLALMLLLPVAIVSIWALAASSTGVLSGQVNNLSRYVGYLVRDSYARGFLLESLLTRLPPALGTYNLPLILLGGWCLLEDSESFPTRFLLPWVAIVSLMLLATLPDHRYFMVTFPALAIIIARGIRVRFPGTDRPIILSLLYCAGMLYLFVDWNRASHVFLP